MISHASAAIAAAVLALAALTGAAQAQDADRFNPENAVSSAEINGAEKGYLLTLSNGTEVRITGARANARPQRDCNVHIPSLTRRIENGLRNGALEPIGTGAQTVHLQVNQDPSTGELWCGGAGSGCTITIQ